MNTELNNLIMDNEKLIYFIINKYSNYYEFDDLYQAASLGIVKAYNNYDASFNTKFTSYAYPYILGEVYSFVNNNRDYKVNKEYLKLYKKINEAKTVLTQKLMKEPSNYELSIFLDMDENVINEISYIGKKADSLDRIIIEDGKNLLLEDIICDNKDNYNIDNMLLKENIDNLSIEEQSIIKMHYFEDKTQQEIANYLGINQVQVSRYEKKSLKKLKKMHENVA